MKLLLKSLMVGMAISCFSSCTSKKGQDQSTPTENVATDSAVTFVRKNAYTNPAAQADIDALAKAMSIMKQQPCDSTTSWYYQGAIHWIPDTSDYSPNQPPQFDTLCPSYKFALANIKKAWQNCTHAANSEYNFLVWHRLYVYHFEKIVRQLSGKKDFALPYWGYTDTTNASRFMPTTFWKNKTGSLYENARLARLNTGQGIDPAFFKSNLSRDVINALFKSSDYLSFNTTLDNGIHGLMHDYIGGGYNNMTYYNRIYQGEHVGLMSDVATAGFDPIFWMHHSNVDRLWYNWTLRNEGNSKALVTASILNGQPWAYTFFDEHGKVVTYSTAEILKIIYNLGYQYDDQTKLFKVSPNLVAMQTQQPARSVLFTQKVEAPITKYVTNFTVQNNNPSKHGQLELLRGSNNSGNIIEVEVTVSFTKQPKGIYKFYLNVPGTSTKQEFIGLASFFGALHHAAPATGTGHNHAAPTGPLTQTFRFDVTSTAIIQDALKSAQFDVSVVKDGGAPSEISVKSISVVKR